MTLVELVEKHKLNMNELARRCDMLPATFRNKLHGNLGSRFSIGELEKLRGVLEAMGADMVAFCKE